MYDAFVDVMVYWAAVKIRQHAYLQIKLKKTDRIIYGIMKRYYK